MGTWLAFTADEDFLMRTNATAGVIASLLVAGAVVTRFAPVIPIAVAVLGGAYAALLWRQVDVIDTSAPVLAAALLAVAELAYWSIELRSVVADESGTYLRRAALLAVLFVGVIAIGTSVLAVAEAVSADGIAVEVVGAAAAVTALALVVFSARKAPP